MADLRARRRRRPRARVLDPDQRPHRCGLKGGVGRVRPRPGVVDSAAGEPQGPEATEGGLSRAAGRTRSRDCAPHAKGRVSRFVFPGQARGKPLSNMALLTLLKRMNSGAEKNWIDPAIGRRITAHGFRATFRTWAEEVATFPHAVIEQAMGHQVGTQVERAYRRTDVLDKRRQLMDTWAQWCEPEPSSNVVQLARANS